MYKITFNTSKFENKQNRREWENQLRNDFAVAINGKEYICKDENELKKRFEIIAGHETSTNDEDYFYLQNERYNKQRLLYGMYGIACGYVSFDKTLEKIKSDGNIIIPFGAFYDLRQGNFFKGCFVEIETV